MLFSQLSLATVLTLLSSSQWVTVMEIIGCIGHLDFVLKCQKLHSFMNDEFNQSFCLETHVKKELKV